MTPARAGMTGVPNPARGGMTGVKSTACAEARARVRRDDGTQDQRPSTRSPVPSGVSVMKRRASASTKAAALRCVTATPLGLPVEPEVTIAQASSSGVGSVRSWGARSVDGLQSLAARCRAWPR